MRYVAGVECVREGVEGTEDRSDSDHLDCWGPMGYSRDCFVLYIDWKATAGICIEKSRDLCWTPIFSLSSLLPNNSWQLLKFVRWELPAPFYRWGNWGLAGFGQWSKVTQLVKKIVKFGLKQGVFGSETRALPNPPSISKEFLIYYCFSILVHRLCSKGSTSHLERGLSELIP